MLFFDLLTLIDLYVSKNTLELQLNVCHVLVNLVLHIKLVNEVKVLFVYNFESVYIRVFIGASLNVDQCVKLFGVWHWRHVCLTACRHNVIECNVDYVDSNELLTYERDRPDLNAIV